MTEFDFSEGFERLDAAFGEGAEVVPFIAQMHEFAMRVKGISGRKFYTDAKTLVRGTAEVSRDFGFDVPTLFWDGYNVEAEALGANLVLFDDMAPAIDNVDPLIKTEKDLAKLKSPDPYTAGRMPMVMEAISEYKALIGRSTLPCYCAPFTLASHVMTFENLIYQIQDNPKFVHKVMTFLVDEVIAPFMNACFKEFPEASAGDGSDAVASLPFITQSMLEEFSLQYIERLRKQCSKPIVCDNWWGDDSALNKQEFWDLKLRATPGYLKIQDPDLWKVGVDGPMAYAKAKDKPVVLGIDNNLFQSGSEDEIRQRVHEYMEAIEGHGGRGAVYYCSLSAVTPPQNVEIAIDAANQFRSGDRPWAGQHMSGTPEPRDETGATVVAVDQAAIAAAAQEAASPNDELLDAIFDAVLDHEDEESATLVQQAIDQKISVHEILDEGLIAAMDEVGEEFSAGKIFVPEMLMAARAMKAGLEVVRPILSNTGAPSKGKVLLATVQGDVHDIGKNLVGMMLEGAGYEVIDMGVNKTPDEILEMANELDPIVVGLSALLTTSMPSMERTVSLFKEKRSKYPVIVGGAPVTQTFADHIGADGYGENAPHAVEVVQGFAGWQNATSVPA